LGLIQDTRDGISWLTFDRQDKLNAFKVADYRELRLAIERAIADRSVRTIVLSGTGRAFSAGADRSLLDGTAPAADMENAGAEFSALLQAIGHCAKPIFAAVNGLAIGFGCTLMLYCDLIVMSKSARLRLPFTALGIVPEAGSSYLMATRARWSDTVWAMFSSEWIDAQAAYEMGLAWRVVPDAELITIVEDAAAKIAALDPAAVAATKRLLIAGRAEMAEAAAQRELAELGGLLSRGAANDSDVVRTANPLRD
jgi:enoyl-CoA hydratase/carnithine racemase